MPHFEDREFSIDGHRVAYIEGGKGYPLLMIHGSGPGASTLGNWSRVLGPLSERYHVHAMDLIGFGKSDRKKSEPFFDLDLWIRQCKAMLAKIPGETVGIIAHSISASLALQVAASESRVGQVLTTGAMGAKFTVNEGTVACWTFPETRADLQKAVGFLINDKSLIDDAYLDARVKVLHEDPSYKDYFSRMFAGDRQRYADLAIIDPPVLARIKCPVTMLHGRVDEPFPPATTLKLADHIPQADVVLLANCSHSVALERTDALLSAAQTLFPQPQ
ncbi:alpha/beta fold hydrolase [Sinorhizobium chiapasense]|uniref:Alpha/beta fold hydrolase n=1 Tax=Sinorhizobium chiapasense TaxID=501572 RepID=A0ABZ2BK67_9HYPH